jgi:hypothetical protein
LDLIFDADDVRALQYAAAVVSFRAAQLVSMGNLIPIRILCNAYLFVT